MRLFGKDLDADVVVVAEIGVNHEGSVDKALELIRLAAGAGVDAVKFQTYTPERFVSAADAERLARVRRFSLDETAHRRLAREAAAHGVAFVSTAVTEDVIPLLAELCAAIKIASGDLDFQPTIEAAMKTGKPVILSTGNGSVDEIDRAVAWARAAVDGKALEHRLALMQCVSAYPTPIEQANVRAIPFLQQRYGLTVGYSNHVVEPEATLAAVALGAHIVELHFTDQRSGRAFRDHALSYEPEQLAAIVASAKRVRASLGRYEKRPQSCEQESRQLIRKGVVAARDLPSGTVLAAADLMYARPATEFSANEIFKLHGRRLAVAVRRGELIPRSAVDGP